MVSAGLSSTRRVSRYASSAAWCSCSSSGVVATGATALAAAVSAGAAWIDAGARSVGAGAAESRRSTRQRRRRWPTAAPPRSPPGTRTSGAPDARCPSEVLSSPDCDTTSAPATMAATGSAPRIARRTHGRRRFAGAAPGCRQLRLQHALEPRDDGGRCGLLAEPGEERADAIELRCRRLVVLGHAGVVAHSKGFDRIEGIGFPQRDGEQRAGPEHPGLDRTSRYAEELRRLAGAEPGDVAQHDGLAELVRQRRERALQRSSLGILDVRIARCDGLVDAVVDGLVAAAPAADDVVRGVGGDAVEPGGDARAAAEAPERAVGVQERVLQRVLGVGRVPRQAQRDGVHPVAVADDQLVECRPVASLRAPDELLVRSSTAHPGPRAYRSARCAPISWTTTSPPT